MTKYFLEKLHDWEIISVSTDLIKKMLTIEVIQPEEKLYKKINFIDVFEFYLSKMRMQNVILDVMILKKNSNSDYYDYCLKLLNIEKLKVPSNFSLIYFEPSVGVEIACICREIVVINNETRIH